MKSGNLNFLEPSGPLQACNGTALKSVNTIVYIPDLVIIKYFGNNSIDIKRTVFTYPDLLPSALIVELELNLENTCTGEDCTSVLPFDITAALPDAGRN